MRINKFDNQLFLNGTKGWLRTCISEYSCFPLLSPYFGL